MVVAGDFAQLPPMSGHSLYNGLVALKTMSAMNQKMQNAVLGRILWHQFNTLVILRQNMRQKEQTPLDAKMRTALVNMRYAACTPEDIDFLRSRVASDCPDHPHLDTADYRNVSVITALNVHKDTINDLGAERFAADNRQELVDFFSVDKLTTRAVDRFKWSGCEQARFKALGPKLQQALWNAMPSTTSEHIPGRLRLCVNMPVMIKANDATKLCITKGQEAIIAGWDSSVGPVG
ncbi:hypothetical protein B0H17DRAFT_929974 [Mycena rosella]|uniref:ATP-dependent DNA helicase n=1 Tax=Mycena rosella TaxID=1033263 RepID=A0AAD7DP57_MYCRO|nr:hypothetical protein B0H17DRAFT_929974 [Mycena rosella]